MVLTIHGHVQLPHHLSMVMSHIPTIYGPDPQNYSDPVPPPHHLSMVPFHFLKYLSHITDTIHHLVALL